MESPTTIMGIAKTVIIMNHIKILKGVATLVRGLQDAIIIMIGMSIILQVKTSIVMKCHNRIKGNLKVIFQTKSNRAKSDMMSLNIIKNVHTKRSMKREHLKSTSKLFRFLLHQTTIIIKSVIPMTIGAMNIKNVIPMTIDATTIIELQIVHPMMSQMMVMMMRCLKMEEGIIMFNLITVTFNQ
jgi:hypothetical protein